MSVYHRILAVVDLSADGTRVAERAHAIVAACPGASLQLLHVVEYVPVEPLSDSLLPAVQLVVLGSLLIVAIIATNLIYSRTQR